MGNWKINVSGSFKDLADDYYFRVEQQEGAGMPPISNISTPQALLDGDVYNRTRTTVRTFTLTGTFVGGDIPDFHDRRRELISIISPHRSNASEPIELQYIGGGCTLQASAYYDGGMELGQVQRRHEAQIPVQFKMFDPYVENSVSSSANLAVINETTLASLIQESSGGGWESIPTSPSTPIYDVKVFSDNRVHVVGNFGDFGGSSFGGDDKQVLTWDGSTLGSLQDNGSALNGGNAYILAEGPNYVLAGGAFLECGSSLTACYIAKYQDGEWLGLASGLRGNYPSASDNFPGVAAIIIDNLGNTIAGGDFVQAGSDLETASGLARYTASAATWDDMGACPNARITDMYYDRGQNKLHVVGHFDEIAGLTENASRYAVMDMTTGAWTSNASFNSPINAIAPTADGKLLFGGEFDAIGSMGASGLAIYDHISYSPVACGVNNDVHNIYVDSDGLAHIFGIFSKTGNVSIPSYILYDGYSLVGADIDLGWPPEAMAELNGTKVIGRVSDLLGGNAIGVTTVTNIGTAKAYPIITASGPGQLIQVANLTTDITLYFDNFTLLDGEVITIDLRPNQKTVVSSFRGNTISFLSQTSRIAEWSLIPGDNLVGVFINNTTASATLTFNPRYWSFDGSD